MEKRYIEDFPMRAAVCDMFGGWRPGAMFEAMQETAGAHRERLGLGRPVMDGLGVAWVLSRARVELRRRPRLGETVSVETFPLPPKHLFYPRANVFRDAAGQEIGYANSLWVLIDLATRRIVNHPAVQERLPDNGDLTAPIALPATVRPLDGEVRRAALEPQFVDFDLNGHVNNTRYLDWCCNALGPDILREREILRLDVNYDAEVLPGMRLETELTRRDDRFAFCGSVDGKRRFAIGGELRAR